jgi:hypothetical protein
MKGFVGGRSFTAAVILTLAALMCGGSGYAVERPFKGRIIGAFVDTPTSDPAVFTSVARAMGRGTHVGAFSKVTDDLLNVVTGWVDGSFTMTTANGDLLRGFYTGYVVPGAPGTFAWVLDSTITGGTGRFVNATGSFVFTAEGTFGFVDGLIEGAYTETFDGTIDF